MRIVLVPLGAGLQKTKLAERLGLRARYGIAYFEFLTPDPGMHAPGTTFAPVR